MIFVNGQRKTKAERYLEEFRSIMTFLAPKNVIIAPEKACF